MQSGTLRVNPHCEQELLHLTLQKPNASNTMEQVGALPSAPDTRQTQGVNTGTLDSRLLIFSVARVSRLSTLSLSHSRSLALFHTSRRRVFDLV